MGTRHLWQLQFCAGLTGMLLLSGTEIGRGHGAVHLQIIQLTEQITKNPDQHDLYLQRGELYRIHRLWDSALSDLETARALTTNQAQLDFNFGRLFLEAGWPETAKTVLDRFLGAFPNQGQAYLLRARALLQLDRPLDASKDFSKAIEHATRPSPGYYVERARALAAAGPDHIPAALEGLDAGLEKLGPLVTLQLPAIELEMQRKDYDRAVARLDKIAELSPRKETWLKRRGDVLWEAGRKEEARRDYQRAMKALNALPATRRYVPAMIELEEDLLSRLEQPQPPAPAPAPAKNEE